MIPTDEIISMAKECEPKITIIAPEPDPKRITATCPDLVARMAGNPPTLMIDQRVGLNAAYPPFARSKR